MSTAKRLVLSLRGRKESQSTTQGTSSTRLVSANSTSPGHELDEIAVVSGSAGIAESSHVSYGSLSLGQTNGPRYIPDDDGKACFDDSKLSRHHSHSLNGTDAAIMHLAPPPLEAVGSDFNTIQTSSTLDHNNRNSVSRQSLMDIVSAKLGMSGPQLGQSISQQGFFSSSRDSLSASGTSRPLHSHVSATTSEMDLSRKDRKRERSKLKSGDQPLLGSWSRTGPRESNAGTTATGATRASTNHLVPPCGTGSTCNGADRYMFGRRSGCSTSSRKSNGRRWSFVFDPAGRLCYYWSMVVSMAFLYNFWVIIYRFAFQEINGESIVLWFCLDYFSDFLYLVDILFHFRTGYLEDGVLQTDSTKLRQHYMNSTTFYIDCLCLLPLDFLYLSIGFNSILRSFRLVKIYRFWAFMDRTERHTNYPNLFRSTSLIHYLLVIFHWNGCLYHIIYKNNGFGSKNWVFHDSESADVVKQYLQSYYWCTLALTTIGDLPRPRSKAEYVFVIAQLLFGLMLFATVLGHVANIVTSVSAARKEFQAKLDGVKTYMRMRRVPNHLQVKVIKWFDYLWLTQKCSDEERAVSCLPDKLKAEIAINVHLDTLKRVEIFQNTEAGFLCELVLKLRPVLFSPGDFICRKGEVGKEMYIVNRGRLQVVADNGKTVMASLKAGSYFGEISILNMGTAGKALGNRRTASVRSVGYSDLFVLSKKDMWDVLKEYPAARVRLEAIAVKRLENRMTSPRSHRGELAGSQQPQSPGSVSPSVHSSGEERPRSRATSHQTSRPQSQPSRTGGGGPGGGAGGGAPSGRRSICASVSGFTTNESNNLLGPPCDSLTHIESSGATPLLGSHEALEGEIKRLRERLHTVESENFSLNAKLAQQQWEVEHRLAEIEMQICGASSASSISQENETEDLERNRESII
ncbi:cyclic nucleotide-gated olfactory channel isoform X4 [Culex pipiens pallens]|uniref:cyclic nucleotide-gated olfactory channel isoform X4 n=1 Tax=Culex pipiens pallens TaxID=42434 RepID=UPI00195311A3|nr:cyclic nucleotide-gated olfactory channel isoform X4 [Culex pipiens pallens]